MKQKSSLTYENECSVNWRNFSVLSLRTYSMYNGQAVLDSNQADHRQQSIKHSYDLGSMCSSEMINSESDQRKRKHKQRKVPGVVAKRVWEVCT